MEYTPNSNLYKPNRNDDVDIDTSLAENFTKIDSQLAQTETDLGQRGINVKAFGAKGDGSDATSAFQLAINSVGVVREIFVPSGSYLLSDLNLPSDIKIKGSVNSILILGKEIEITNKKNITIENLFFTTNTTYLSCFDLVNCEDFLFKNCKIDGKGFNGETPLVTGMTRGINVQQSKRIHIIDCELKNFRTGKGIEFDGCVDCKALNNYVHHTGRAGISVTRDNKLCEVNDNRLEYNVINFTTGDGALDLYGPNNEDTILRRNIITNYGSASNHAIGIRIMGSKTTVCSKNIVTTCPFSSSAITVSVRDGISCSDTEFEGNKINVVNRTLNVVRIRDDGKNVKFKNNVMVGNGTVESNVIIEFRDTCDVVQYENNIIDCPTIPARGLLFTTAGTLYSKIIVKNNTHRVLHNCVTFGKCQDVVCEANYFDSLTYTSEGQINTNGSTNVILKHNFLRGSNARITNTGVASVNVIQQDNVLIPT